MAQLLYSILGFTHFWAKLVIDMIRYDPGCKASHEVSCMRYVDDHLFIQVTKLWLNTRPNSSLGIWQFKHSFTQPSK